jgi:anthranilate phosphoribosyltransferase
MSNISQITPQEALLRTIEHREIFHDEMLHIMRLIMAGEMSPVMMAALITGLRVKKETIGEITAAAQVMREFSTKVDVADKTHLVDIVGTGGDGSHTFNISTCAMFVARRRAPRSASTVGAASAARAAAPT